VNCSAAAEHLDAFLDSTLGAGKLAEVNDHLTGCADCRKRFEREGRLLRSLRRRVESDRSPPELWNRMMTALDDVERRTGMRVPQRLRGAVMFRFAVWATAAAAVFAAVLMVITFIGFEHPPEYSGAHARRQGEELTHTHAQIPSWEQWERRQSLPQAGLHRQIEQFVASCGEGRWKFEPPAASGHTLSAVNAQILEFRSLQILHVAWNCCGEPASLFLVSDFPEAVDLIAEMQRGADRGRRFFKHRRLGRMWVAALADHGHDLGFLLDGFKSEDATASAPVR